MKWWIFILLCVLGTPLRAQYIGSSPTLIPVQFNYDQAARSGNPMTINYDESDELFWGPDYQRALFPIHRGYDTIAGQNLVYGLYTLDSLIKSDNTYTISFGNVNNLVLDSMDIELGHVKNSGSNDTLFFTLLGLDTVNFPIGAIVFKDTMVLSSSLSPSNILTNTYSLRWRPDFTMGNQPVGLKIEFVGSLQDTLALMGGYGIFPSPNSCTDSSWDKSRKSIFYSNSYAYYSNFNLILPTNVGGDVFYDCNNNVIKDTSDSESYIQNWAITSYVSAPSIGLDKIDDPILTIYPNPASNIMLVNSVLPYTAVKIYNGAGNCIKTFGNTTWIDVSDLNDGIYIFAFEYEKTTVRRKVVIQH